MKDKTKSEKEEENAWKTIFGTDKKPEKIHICRYCSWANSIWCKGGCPI